MQSESRNTSEVNAGSGFNGTSSFFDVITYVPAYIG